MNIVSHIFEPGVKHPIEVALSCVFAAFASQMLVPVNNELRYAKVKHEALRILAKNNNKMGTEELGATLIELVKKMGNNASDPLSEENERHFSAYPMYMMLKAGWVTMSPSFICLTPKGETKAQVLLAMDSLVSIGKLFLRPQTNGLKKAKDQFEPHV